MKINKLKIKRWWMVFIYQFVKGDIITKKFFLKKFFGKIKNKIFYTSLKKSGLNEKLESKQLKLYEKYFETFLKIAFKSNSDKIVFIFTGTTYIGKDYRNNRNMAFAKILAEKKIPIIYSYHRWDEDESIPKYDNNYLLQIPIDITKQKIYDVCNFNFGDKRRIFIIGFPHFEAVRYLGLLKKQGWIIVYECRDNWEEFYKCGEANWYKPEYEEYIINHSDILIAVSKPLKKKLDSIKGTKSTNLIPNGLTKSFIKNENKEKIITSGKRGLKIIGYFGHLTPSWFDWELINNVAKKYKTWRFEIIGIGEPLYINLPSNIAVYGPKNHSDVIKIASKWDVAIIPFKQGKLAEAVDPIKIYEYLALGLPTVSSHIHQVIDYPYTYCYKKKGDFPRLINKAMKIKIDYNTIKKFLKNRYWENRVEDTLNHIGDIK